VTDIGKARSKKRSTKGGVRRVRTTCTHPPHGRVLGNASQERFPLEGSPELRSWGVGLIYESGVPS
jgi:hypothetical protein